MSDLELALALRDNAALTDNLHLLDRLDIPRDHQTPEAKLMRAAADRLETIHYQEGS